MLPENWFKYLLLLRLHVCEKRKLNNVAKKNEASRDLIAKLASLHEDSKKQSLKKSHERVDKFEEKVLP